MSEVIRQALEGMRRNGFEVIEMKSAKEAQEYLLSVIDAGKSVGVGGSISAREIGVLPALEAKGCTVYSHWGVPAEEVKKMRDAAGAADVYLCSANAVTRSGKLVLVDGSGNRVGAICDGPEEVYLIISHSKVVDGGIDAAIQRIKTVACPLNARRLNLDTPCAKTGKCGGYDCADSMCRLTLVVDRVPRGRKMTVLFVEEKLGY